MANRLIIALFYLLSGCSIFDESYSSSAEEQSAGTHKADMESLSQGTFVSRSGVLVPGKYNIKDSELEKLILAVSIGEKGEMFLFEPTDSGGWLILNCRVLIHSVQSTEDYRITLHPCREEIMNSKRVRYDVAIEDAIYKVIAINFSRGLFYDHAEVAFLQNDGGRRIEKGLIEVGK